MMVTKRYLTGPKPHEGVSGIEEKKENGIAVENESFATFPICIINSQGGKT